MKAALLATALGAASCVTLLTSCAGPPLALYTLEEPASPNPPALTPHSQVIEITRTSLPDDIDNEDIVLSDGSRLRKSSHGRWASRLSLQVTDLIRQRLASRYPTTLVTDQPQTEPPSMYISINITTLVVTSGGAASVPADWEITSQNLRKPSLRYRREFDTSGPVATDREIVALETTVVSRLADSVANDLLP